MLNSFDDMNIKEIRASGLLELYVVGDLSEKDIDKVISYLNTYPELNEDLKEIEKALGNYAFLNKKEPSPGIKENLLNDIRSQQSPIPNPPKFTSNFWKRLGILSSVFLIGSLIFGLMLNNQNQKVQNELEELKIHCDSIEAAQNQQLAFYQSLFDDGNDVFAVTPTAKYANTDLFLYNNNSANKTYLQLTNLPAISNQQVFQLWSLKGNDAPIPLDIFVNDSAVIELTFEPNTDVYAITVEPAGGSLTPNLDELIGTFALNG